MEKYKLLDSMQQSIKELKKTLDILYSLPVHDIASYSAAAGHSYYGIDTMIDDLTEQCDKFFSGFTNMEKWYYICRQDAINLTPRHINEDIRTAIFNYLPFDTCYDIVRQEVPKAEQGPQTSKWVPMIDKVAEHISDEWVESLELKGKECILHSQTTGIIIFDTDDVDEDDLNSKFKRSLAVIGVELILKYYFQHRVYNL